jgi:hypothetical protein
VDLMAGRLQHPHQRAADILVIVDQDNPGHRRLSRICAGKPRGRSPSPLDES